MCSYGSSCLINTINFARCKNLAFRGGHHGGAGLFAGQLFHLCPGGNNTDIPGAIATAGPGGDEGKNVNWRLHQ